VFTKGYEKPSLSDLKVMHFLGHILTHAVHPQQSALL
jgi:hypothetical protein